MATLSSLTPLPSSVQLLQREAAVQSPDSSPNSSQPHQSCRRMSVQPSALSQLRASKAMAQRPSSQCRLSFKNRSHHRRSRLLPLSRSHFPPVPAFQDPASSLAIIGAIHTTTLAKLFAKRQEVLSPARNIVEQSGVGLLAFVGENRALQGYSFALKIAQQRLRKEHGCVPHSEILSSYNFSI
ncbi:ABC transporter B family member [Arachis hypogaea]|nr:ABC transporter B family member [Arachis hypogaea]